MTGCDTGDCDISLDLAGLTDFPEGLADGDTFVAANDSEADDPERGASAKVIANYVGAEVAGSNLTWNSSTGQLDAAAGVTANPGGVATGTARTVEIGGTVYNTGPVRLFTSEVSYGSDFNSHVVIDAAGYTPAVGDIVLFQHDTGAGNELNYNADQQVELDVGDEGPVRTRIEVRGSLRDMVMTDIVRYEWMAFIRAGSFWHLLFRTYKTSTPVGARATRTSNLTVAADTVTAVTFESQEFDDCDCWAVQPQPTRLTVGEGITRAKVWGGALLSSPDQRTMISLCISAKADRTTSRRTHSKELRGQTTISRPLAEAYRLV